MKPLIKLHARWHDAGWDYELWICASEKKFAIRNTPLAAFMAWSAKP